MAQYLVTGGTPLTGHVAISGNKNSILPLMAASTIAGDPVTLTNVPSIRDVAVMSEILASLGAKITTSDSTLTIDPTGIKSSTIDPALSQKLRASIILLGPLLAKFGQVSLGFPGGDVIGKRAIGTHLDALTNYGCRLEINDNIISGNYSAKPTTPVEIFLDETSVTATENTLIFSALQPVTTIIDNAACEPHVVDTANFLVKLGAKIDGLGSNRLTITGTTSPASANFSVGPDYIDAGTFAIAAAATHGQVSISPVDPPHLHLILLYLNRFGVKHKITGDTLEILPGELSADPEKLGIRQKFQTRPWPGFPTDLMSPLVVLATQATGSVLFHDWMYETRMFFTDKLVSMGANITLCDPHRVIVTGPTPLRGRHTASPDIRAGMSLLIASLAAAGDSVIDHAELIERGYEDPVSRFSSLGAKIRRADSHD
ncbi:UDP-N-acetylglucosamine 1-carboxyvinyltransferase [Candidatus Amesbacteria bacterium]|nr:UDP-N-acetylglucosamine 1-carboxyvinyltransferase [Candidatus Amesbacteria bacterium]MBI2587522.1 UDP-N-acetylglucosamine 1-carboxyvinyltransferase [Candidatus Amesbacteria bacterium]